MLAVCDQGGRNIQSWKKNVIYNASSNRSFIFWKFRVESIKILWFNFQKLHLKAFYYFSFSLSLIQAYKNKGMSFKGGILVFLVIIKLKKDSEVKRPSLNVHSLYCLCVR